MSNISPKTAKKWTCAECGVTVSRANGERVALPDAWTQTGEGTFCLLCRRDTYLKVGGMDEGYFLYMEDIDFCWRIRRLGFQVVYFPAVRIAHVRGASTKKEEGRVRWEYRKSQLLLYRKHGKRFGLLVVRLYLRVKYRLALLACRLSLSRKQGKDTDIRKETEQLQEILRLVRTFHY